MSTRKVAISLDPDAVKELDRLVVEAELGSRSRAIQVAVREKLARLRRDRLSRECAKLDPATERSMGEEGISADLRAWPEY